MSEITPFNFEGNAVRWVMIGGEPWFVAGDVCAVLGIQNARMATDRLEREDVSFADVSDPNGFIRKSNVINESGLYELIIRSNKPDARRFRRWITAEVLPSLRKTGEYKIVETQPDDDLVPIEQMIRRLRETRRRVDALEVGHRMLAGEQEALAAKVSAAQGEYDEFTTLAYAKINGLPTDRISCQRHGQRATAEMKRRGGAPRKVQDATFGMINVYPLGILDATRE
jgi:prophage antirepressor-like protein